MTRINSGTIEPHGGKLVSRILNKKDSSKITADRRIKRIPVADDLILDIEKIAIGAYSPLNGFMCKDDFSEVVHNMRLSDGTAWTIPIYLPVGGDTAKTLQRKDRVVICDSEGKDIALLNIRDIFSFPKDVWAQKVYATLTSEHPGVKKVYDAHDKFLGGDIDLISRPRFPFEKYNLDPLETRAHIKKMGWKTVSGFQTRNAPHRAHEYLQKIALSVTDGILIHPIIGWKKDGDFLPDLIIKTYDILIRNYFPSERVLFAGLATAMRYAGPREAVFHAIIRKNYGCTHFITGRDHAGVGNFYGLYEAHKIFDKFPEIGITPLLLRGPYYCSKCGDVVSDKICPHGEKWRKHISGTLIRKLIADNRKIPSYLMRPEVSAFVLNYKKNSKNGEGWCI